MIYDTYSIYQSGSLYFVILPRFHFTIFYWCSYVTILGCVLLLYPKIIVPLFRWKIQTHKVYSCYTFIYRSLRNYKYSSLAKLLLLQLPFVWSRQRLINGVQVSVLCSMVILGFLECIWWTLFMLSFRLSSCSQTFTSPDTGGPHRTNCNRSGYIQNIIVFSYI